LWQRHGVVLKLEKKYWVKKGEGKRRRRSKDMSSFTTPLIVTILPDGRRGKLFHQFTYHIGTKCSKDFITVPVGFVTDFASSPFFVWSFIPPWGRYSKAAVIHDYIYQTKIRTRKEADDIFLEAMLVLGVPAWKAKLMYWGVRTFGWIPWLLKSKS